MTYTVLRCWTHEEMNGHYSSMVVSGSDREDCLKIAELMTADLHPADDMTWFEVRDENDKIVYADTYTDMDDIPF